MTYFLPDWNRSGYQRGGPPGGGDPGMKGTGQSYGSSYGPGRDPRPGGGDPGMIYTRPNQPPVRKRDDTGIRPFNPIPFERKNFMMKMGKSPAGPMGLGALRFRPQASNMFNLDAQEQQIQLLALELMNTEGLSGFEAMDKAEETIKKKVFVEKGGSEYAEYISEPRHEGFSMRTRQELPTGPHSDWRSFQIRDYVEDDPLQRFQTDYMHSPITITNPSKYSDMEAAEGGLAGTPFSRGGILGAF